MLEAVSIFFDLAVRFINNFEEILFVLVQRCKLCIFVHELVSFGISWALPTGICTRNALWELFSALEW